MQTNGVLLDDAWVDLCAELGLSVSVSLDGPPSVHDSQRVNAAGAGSHHDAVAAIERIQRHAGMEHLFGGVLCVVNPNEDGRTIYRHFRSLGITNMDFLLPVEANWTIRPPASRAPRPLPITSFPSSTSGGAKTIPRFGLPISIVCCVCWWAAEFIPIPSAETRLR